MREENIKERFVESDWISWLVSSLLLGRIVLDVFLCPYTKVEESFNMQAMHDFLEHGFNYAAFDHRDFPGVVPRTSIGALIISLLSTVPHELLRSLNAPKVYSQYLVRICLGILTFLCMRSFRSALVTRFRSKTAGDIFMLLTAAQFHLAFYASRSLPNTFSVQAVLLSYSLWMKSRPVLALVTLGAAMTIFRCDLLLLLGPLAGTMLFSGEVPFWRTLWIGIGTCTLALLVSVAIDSPFWGYLVWPEGGVLFFNTVENRSSEYGTEGALFYFTHALPKALTATVGLVLVGMLTAARSLMDRAGDSGHELYYVAPALVYVFLYSILPHKELRFLFPVLPVFNMIAAVGCTYATKSLRWLAAVGLLGAVAAAAGATILSLAAARHNYPGAEALIAAHAQLPSPVSSHAPCVAVHIDAYAATRGVTRFLELRSSSVVGELAVADPDVSTPACVQYSKDEEACDLAKYDMLITGDPHGGCHQRIARGFEVTSVVQAFRGLSVSTTILREPLRALGLVEGIMAHGLDALVERADDTYVMRNTRQPHSGNNLSTKSEEAQAESIGKKKSKFEKKRRRSLPDDL